MEMSQQMDLLTELLQQAPFNFLLAEHQFSMVYQPQVRLSNTVVSCVEALLRCQHATLGEINPAIFIQAAEAVGQINQVTEWVVTTACQQISQWQNAGYSLLPVAINISAGDLATDNLLNLLSRLHQENPNQLQWLQLEITECFLLRDIEFAINQLNAIHQLGIEIAIDDFGTGYSSLNYLTQLPVDKIKIDQSFTRKLFANPRNKTVVNAILDLAKHLKLAVCAEGIETQAQYQYLRSRGALFGQGYYFAKPMSADIFAQLYLDGNQRATGI